MPARRKLPSVRGPVIRKLGSRGVKALLERNHVGRIAFLLDNHVELHPVHYVYSDGHIYGRTSFGAKYVAWMHRPYVAFEVDESEGPYDWRSVIVRGTVYVLLPRGSRADRADYNKAAKLIKRRQPLAFGPRDPAPYRSVVFRIAIHETSGRQATTG